MSHRFAPRLLWALFAFAVASFSAPAAENGRLILARAGFGSAGATANQQLRTQLIAEPFRATEGSASRAHLLPGQLAASTDNAGLITQARLREAILGISPILDPIALDFAGNRDGVINVADLVALVARLIA